MSEHKNQREFHKKVETRLAEMQPKLKARQVKIAKKIETVKKNAKKLKPNQPTTNAPKKLKLLVTIVNKNKAEFYQDLLQSFEINLQIVMLAQGTATSEIRHVLGLEESDKAVIFSVVREDKAKKALQTLEQKFQTIRNGKGIAYTIPLSSVMGVATYQFLSNNRMTVKEKEAK